LNQRDLGETRGKAKTIANPVCPVPLVVDSRHITRIRSEVLPKSNLTPRNGG
jgi:hypothetical protein